MTPYRKRFVQLNLLLIGIVLTIMVAAVAVYMTRDYYHGLRATMEQVVAPLENFDQPPKKDLPKEDPSKKDPPQKEPSKKDPSGKDLPREETGRRGPEQAKNILAVLYSKDSGSYHVLSPENPFSDEELQSCLDEIVEQKSEFGILQGKHIIYYRSGTMPYRIAIASTEYITHSVVKLVLALLAIWLGAMAIFLAISIRLSALAAKPMEEAMQREKQFVADASHDLKTPLSVILANTSILMENPETSVGSVSRWLESTQTAARRMQQLISQMLTLAETERPESIVEKKEVDLGSIAMKAALELESLAYEKKVVLDTKLPESCMLCSSGEDLLHIVSSLLENALKYEPEGGRVLLSLVCEKKNAVLSVQNFGSSIAEQDLPHVFDRFYRSDKSRGSKDGSFGLGLAITREMTERLGGKITARSSREEGTIFTVSFRI